MYNSAETKQYDRLKKAEADAFCPSDVYGAEVCGGWVWGVSGRGVCVFVSRFFVHFRGGFARHSRLTRHTSVCVCVCVCVCATHCRRVVCLRI